MAGNSELTAFKVHDDVFHEILGPNPRLEVLLENDKYPFAHEAGVFIAARNELFITSSQFNTSEGKKTIQISKVVIGNESRPTTCEELPCDDIKMANGGVNFNDDKEVLFCSQGSFDTPSGLYAMSTTPPYETRPIVTSFYGRQFNSVNDVVVHSDGSIWFTDPIYGYKQNFRPPPELPTQVYRYDPRTQNIRVVADGFGRPNGICFSPDEKTVYITDTDYLQGDGTRDKMRASTIYAYDVAIYSGQPFLINRRVFAMADDGIPDGIKCDMNGNVYSGCFDGVNIWSPGGVLLGRILIEGGVANFCFGRGGEMFMLNETKIWRAQLASSVKGALLGI